MSESTIVKNIAFGGAILNAQKISPCPKSPKNQQGSILKIEQVLLQSLGGPINQENRNIGML